jgi:hypothetical protein
MLSIGLALAVVRGQGLKGVCVRCRVLQAEARLRLVGVRRVRDRR